MKKAIVLLSGGLDSAVILAMLKEKEYDKIYALSFDYGQRHKAELNCAISQAVQAGVEDHLILTLDLGQIGGSSLIDKSIDVPKDRHKSGFNWSVPTTYVPARNAIFLSFALSWAEALDIEEIYIGANSLDFAGYPDCRPEFLKVFEKLANISTSKALEGKQYFKIVAPLLTMTKEEIVAEGTRLHVDFSKTSSCYDPDEEGRACGRCDACILRLEGFNKADIKDPIKYKPAK